MHRLAQACAPTFLQYDVTTSITPCPPCKRGTPVAADDRGLVEGRL